MLQQRTTHQPFVVGGETPMSALETRRTQATVNRLMDDLRHLVERERGNGHPADAHAQVERLRWDIARLVKSTTY